MDGFGAPALPKPNDEVETGTVAPKLEVDTPNAGAGAAAAPNPDEVDEVAVPDDKEPAAGAVVPKPNADEVAPRLDADCPDDVAEGATLKLDCTVATGAEPDEDAPRDETEAS